MEFVFNDDQVMMADTARALLAEHCTTKHLRILSERGESFDPARWAMLVEMGLLGALVPEEMGGLGLTGPDFIAIATACGEALLPEPLAEAAMVTLPALAALGQGALVGAVLENRATVALCHPLAPRVHQADRATHLLMIDAGTVVLLPRDAVDLTAQPGIDPLRDLFTVAATQPGETLATGAEAAAAHARATDAGALCSAAQLLGIAQKAIDISVAFAQQRSQFGRPIGSYQAIKHHLASAQVAVEFARPVLHAAAAMPPGAGAATAARISHAKLASGEAADLATRTAVQVHGAMGYSQEVDVHFYLKRALALRQSWGTPDYHRARYAARLSGHAYGPATLFAQET